MMFDFVDGAAGSEIGSRLNRSALSEIQLQPRVLVNVENRSLKTSILGREWDLPFRFIHGTWRMGLGGLETMFGGRSSAASERPSPVPHPDPTPGSVPAPVSSAEPLPGSEVDEPPLVLPIPLPIPLPDPGPIPELRTADPAEKAEQEELARLRGFLADGGDVNARFEEGSLLDHALLHKDEVKTHPPGSLLRQYFFELLCGDETFFVEKSADSHGDAFW